MDPQNNTQPSHPTKTFRSIHFAKKDLLLLLPLLIIIAAYLLVTLHNKTNKSTKDIDAHFLQSKKKADDLSKIVSKQVQIPANETPDVATITDASKLKSQDFFKDAENGDKVLIYENEKIAILYRPNTQKVLAEASVAFNGDQTVLSSSDSASSSSSAAQIPTTKRILFQQEK